MLWYFSKLIPSLSNNSLIKISQKVWMVYLVDKSNLHLFYQVLLPIHLKPESYSLSWLYFLVTQAIFGQMVQFKIKRPSFIDY